MTYCDIIERLHKLGITQCTGAMARNKKGHETRNLRDTAAVCAFGAIGFASESNWLTDRERFGITRSLSRACDNIMGSSVVELNDRWGLTLDEFCSISKGEMPQGRHKL